MITETPQLLIRIKKLRRLKLKLEQDVAILRANGKEIWQRCQLAEAELSAKGKADFVVLNKKLFVARSRIAELEKRCDQSLTDYDRLLESYERIMPFKTCIKCKENKHADLFEKEPRNHSGRGSKCKKCKAGEFQEWKKKRIVKILVQQGVA